jgi:hypothetical protein
MTAKHTFYIEHNNGTTIEWTGLSFKKARDMLAYTSAHQPCDAVRYGWFEEKEPINFTNVTDLTNVSEGAEV